MDGIAKLHELVAKQGGQKLDPSAVIVGIETDRGPWVQALIAAGYQVYAINPRQAARFKERYGTSGAKSDKGDAHALADMVRIDRDQLRPIAGDSEQAQAIEVVARAHQTLIWERTRIFQRLRHALREYFPAALDAYADLTLLGADALELLVKAPTPQAAAKLTHAQITAALARARRRNRTAKAAVIQTALREQHLGLAPPSGPRPPAPGPPVPHPDRQRGARRAGRKTSSISHNVELILLTFSPPLSTACVRAKRAYAVARCPGSVTCTSSWSAKFA
ncbi:IS110 family transposase [Streptomyces sp. NPDC048362]|uniref:IS110 family transposase n=1 Tax=Streptomyces sp. NPDC048362 TaxID=3365539 RepID=UPI003721D22E